MRKNTQIDIPNVALISALVLLLNNEYQKTGKLRKKINWD